MSRSDAVGGGPSWGVRRAGGVRKALVPVALIAMLAAGCSAPAPTTGPASLAGDDCAGTLGEASLAGATEQRSVQTGTQLQVGSAWAGLRQVGTAGGKDAAEVSVTVDGKSVICLLAAGRTYRLGTGQIRLDSITPATGGDAKQPGRAAFTISAG